MPTQLEECIYQMLTTSTGAHMLDSGGSTARGEYGRHWQRNQERTLEDFQNEPVATLNHWGELEISVFHHLNKSLTRSPEMDLLYLEFTKDSEGSHLANIADFIEYLGAEAGYDVNTYNHESALSQVLQYQTFSTGARQYVALQIHQGADVRGGYTRPVIFELEDEYELLSEYASIPCTGSEVHRYDWNGGEWTSDGEYCKALQIYELMTEARKVGITEYIPCYQCGEPLEGTDTRQKVGA